MRTAFDYQGNVDVRSGYGIKVQTDKSEKTTGGNEEEYKGGK